ncbi:hypothetical protein FisN_21Lh257 [Fistulifera solaris]|uniref:Proteasome activator PA28 C-terminal domain-containing protein n=1 Tax=Fistulifera solaris TaxID=1519565 RepID=A0A1Z5KEZ2_FISSO|nr:hypothetical protein FisN_21Lh257 [Fistulifera solaris]|eukprot:GAX24641.1 hypothetical protein FisN_21Lh257 [Fistulifera solaris]
MTKLSAVQETYKKNALALIAASPATAQTLAATYQKHFSTTVAGARAKYASLAGSVNSELDQTIETTIDAVDAVMDDLNTLMRYISLTIPKMEDGGNWGVSIQLEAIKAMQDAQDKLTKAAEEVSKYASSRADVLEKCKFPSQTISVTSTDGTSNTTEKGDAKETRKTTETKETTTSLSPVEANYRQAAVVACDVLYYGKAKGLFQLCLSSYLNAMDFCDKNAEKIEKPKGSTGSGPSSMY